MSKNFGLIILDRSGSMSSMLEQAISGVNSHIEKVAGEVDDIKWSLMLFDSQGIDYLYQAKDSKSVVQLNAGNFVPRSTTPLYDAIGRGLTDLDSFIGSLIDSAKPERVSIVIMTDGLENASIEYTLENVRQMIEEREKRGWQVIYLGANQDAFAVGQSMGIRSTVTYDRDSVVAGMAMASSATSSYYSTGIAPDSHTDVTEDAEEDI